ncbi:MAG: hypothetical protein KatS3mg118_2075 [Paracoccaceae bacterium]|nr:MAG: hypothetical protein KatS3mg118_2075 [Paracoccaceae bacterium]
MIEMDWPDREALHEGLAREVAARLAGALERARRGKPRGAGRDHARTLPRTARAGPARLGGASR